MQAQYVPKQRTIFVRKRDGRNPTICAIAREQAHASFDTVGSGYYRQAYAAQSYCAAYVVAQKFGLTPRPSSLTRYVKLRPNERGRKARLYKRRQTGGLFH